MRCSICPAVNLLVPRTLVMSFACTVTVLVVVVRSS
ncbi:hypothetical protein EW425_09755 [Salmonella enterica subsp. enterica serovar Stanley]|nr:hypothetical protein [Salmonella enterica subsp. enterica serovar Stanley]EGV9182326.1 hypothetical protein [Salmonella enterica]EGX2062903.1 hypothetical protein [Salmonella enterica subsp. enterica serovar Stanley]